MIDNINLYTKQFFVFLCAVVVFMLFVNKLVSCDVKNR